MKRQEVVSLLERFPELFDTDDELLEELTSELNTDDNDDASNDKSRAEPNEWRVRSPR
jgi:hypothetical protein